MINGGQHISKRKSYERMRSIVECAARDDGAHARVLFLTYTTRVAGGQSINQSIIGGLIEILQNPRVYTRK